MRELTATITIGALALACATLRAAEAPSARHGAQPPPPRVLAPIPLEDAVRSESVFGFEASPDQVLVAYVVSESWRRQRSGAAYFLPSGLASTASGARIWVADVQSGRTFPIGDGETARWSSWAPAWSPDGTSLAFVSDRDGAPRLWRWERATGRLTRLSDLLVLQPSRRVTLEAWRLLQWTPDGRAIAVRLLPQGMSVAEVVEYSRLRVGKEGGSTSLDAGSTRESTATVYPQQAPAEGEGSSDARLFMARHRHFLGDLAFVDLATGKASRLASRVHAERYDLSPDGRYLAYYDVSALRVVESATGREVATDTVEPGHLPRVDFVWAPTSDYVLHLVDGALRRVDVASGRASRVTDTALTSLPAWSRDERAFYAVDGARILRLRDTGPSEVVATLDKTRFISWLLDDERQRVLFTKPGVPTVWLWTQPSDSEVSRLQAVSLTTGKVEEVGAPPPNPLERAQSAARLMARRVLFRHEDAAHPNNLWVALPDGEPGADAPRQVSRAGALFDRYVLGQQRLIEWLSDDGDRRRGVLLLPAGYKAGTRVPMVVRVYGGTTDVTGNLNRFGLEGRGDNFQILATRGYAVFLPESVMTGSPMLDLVKNILPGVSKVVELGYADEQRLGICGHSFGGYSTLALIVQTRRFRAAVAYASVSNIASFWGSRWDAGNSESISWAEEPDGQPRLGGTPWQVRQSYIESSPFFYLDRVTTPLLLIHGDADPVPVLQSDQVYFALQRLGKTVEYARYRDVGHSMTDPANELDYWRRLVAWFDKHLGPAAATASQ